jgi:hypothetical protein
LRFPWGPSRSREGDLVIGRSRQKYWAYEFPSIWPIGPDGRVIARDLSGAAIKEAVARALPDR